ncbi:MAG TPA: FtsQ-type POTRA domain-containing protein [Pyrinomonadaceae bacterium]|nr:FtsQ-type POTRA domain-containing protein [Pyrinomonadaceae bacterium]
MAKKAKTNSRSKASSIKLKPRGRVAGKRSIEVSRTAGRFLLPLLIIGVLIVALGIIGSSFYDTAAGSRFFDLKSVDVRGTERTPIDEIRRVVISNAEKTGVWNADLEGIRERVEKFPFVKSAAVSRSLPSGIRVIVTERVPAAVVQLSSGPYLVDTEGMILTAIKTPEKDFPIALRGWDESKTQKAIPDNQARLKVYRKMLDEWKQFDLTSRVKEVNLANPRQPVAVVEDSGRAIAVTLAKDDLGKSLKTAIEALSGKGAKIRSVDAGGIYPVINYIEF